MYVIVYISIPIILRKYSVNWINSNPNKHRVNIRIQRVPFFCCFFLFENFVCVWSVLLCEVWLLFFFRVDLLGFQQWWNSCSWDWKFLKHGFLELTIAILWKMKKIEIINHTYNFSNLFFPKKNLKNDTILFLCEN